MFKVTRWCVQPFERRGGRVSPGEPLQFYTREEALRAARAARKRLAGVRVYEVTGWPVHDIWDRPRLLSAAGETSPRSRCA
jgi:hypothetical protein